MQVGFYGKLPSHGDFVRRRVSDTFVDPWDAWLRQCLPASRATLGARWLEIYLTSPAWRFACAAGACGPAPVIGVMAPSVDQVGRYFPITLVAELAPEVSLLAAAGWEGFFDAAERLVIETLAPEHVDFERFDAAVAALGEDLTAMSQPPALVLDDAAAAILTDTPQPWQLPLTAAYDVTLAFQQLASNHLEAKYRPLVLWWTDGSAMVEPSCLLHKGLPAPALYPAFLDGSWAACRWRGLARHAAAAPLVGWGEEDAERLVFRSAAATDVGRTRQNNEDAFIERPEDGVWAVADGMGGHSHGEVASRMVCDALADFPLDGTFEEAIDAAARRVQEVNEFLVRTAADSDDSGRMGSTVVVLLMRGSRAAALWAGDSRVYRWRAGALEQLTRDHNLAEISGTIGGCDSNVITKAVGVEPNLSLDVYRDSVLPDDRFLLCSDGLTRTVSQEEISSWMAHPDINEAVSGLIRTTLNAGAPDNVTVVIAQARRAAASSAGASSQPAAVP